MSDLVQEVNRVAAMADPEEFLESMARPTGTRLGATFGVSFEVLSP